MGSSRSDLFSDQQNQLANLAKALGHPARIAILEHLQKLDGCVCGSLVEEIGLSQPTISQHLKELKAAGLIQGEIQGRSVCYCIRPDGWEKAQRLLATFFEGKPGDGSCC